MLRELCLAILPPQQLASTFAEWHQVVKLLAEPYRKRRRYFYR
jgi:hypothetical protein